MTPATILMFHGLGGDQHSMDSISRFCSRRLTGAQFSAIEAPINLGSRTEPELGWFVPPSDDQRSLQGAKRPEFEGIVESVALIHQAIDQCVDRGIESTSIHLLGHSQGGAIAIASGLTYPERLGSVCTIAGYLALGPAMTVRGTGTKYFLHHSNHDDNVSVRWAHYAENFIKKIGEPCELECWDIDLNPHWVHVDQLEKICTAISQSS